MADEINTAGQENEAGAESGKTFTQEEVDALIAKRVAREKKGMPSAEELTQFREWQKTQQSEADKLGAAEKARDAANSALEDARNENTLLRMGVPADDVDYYAFKIKKLVTDKKDFETAAKEFLKDKKPSSTVTVEMGAQGGGSKADTANAAMNKLIRGAIK